jgi:hypothetical protein
VDAVPVAEPERAGPDVLGQHHLPAVGVPGQDQRQPRVGRRVERVRVVGEQDRERARPAEGGHPPTAAAVFSSL